MDVRARLTEHRDEVLELAAVHGARNVRVFGSVARGEATARSDLDLLVEMEPGRSLFDMIRLEDALTRLLGCKVQVVSQRGLKSRVRSRILKEATAV